MCLFRAMEIADLKDESGLEKINVLVVIEQINLLFGATREAEIN